MQQQKQNKKQKTKKEKENRQTTCMHLIVHILILHAARPSQRDVSGCSQVDSQVLASCCVPCTHQRGPVYSVASSLSRAPSSLDHRYSRKCMTGVADSL